MNEIQLKKTKLFYELVEYVNEKVDSIYEKSVSNRYKIRNLTNFYMLYTLFHEVNHFDQLLLSDRKNFIGKFFLSLNNN